MKIFKITSKLLLYIIFYAISIGCQNEDIFIQRNNKQIYYYNINSNDAADRLKSIMYNYENISEPTERFKLIHISDAHVSDWSSDNNYKFPNNIYESILFANQEDLLINAIVATGDHISEDKRKDALKYLDAFTEYLYYENNIPTFPCTGNHDKNMQGKPVNEFLTEHDIFSHLTSKVNHPISKLYDKNYFYADLNNPMGGKIRIISLDMLDQEDTLGTPVEKAVFSEAQISWLYHTALKKNMTNQHSVIIILHFPIQPQSKDKSTYLYDSEFAHSWKMIPEIVESFRTKSTLNKTYYHVDNPTDSIEVATDFTNTPGEFICYLGGHAHVMAHFELEKFENQSLDLPNQLMILASNMSPSEEGKVYNQIYRSSMSLFSNSFNIYAIDTAEKNIYITCFGPNFSKTSNTIENGVIKIQYGIN